MDLQTELVFWFVVSACLSGLVVTFVRLRSVPPGWCVVWATVLAVAVAGRLRGSAATVLAALALWILLVAVPMALANLGGRLWTQRRFAAARGVLRLAALLHPADGFREAPTAVTAMELAFRGDRDEAAAMLERLRQSRSPMAATAVVMLCLLRQRWDDLLAWAAGNPATVARSPDALIGVLRALGETGDAAGLVDRYGRERARIDRLVPTTLRDTCRLMLFVFGGRPDVVDRILASGFAAAPADQNRFWQATARWAAGDTEAARREFEALLPEADATSAVAIRRRLEQIDTPPPRFDERGQGLLAAEETRLGQESRYAAPVSVWSPTVRVTQALIALNLAVFAAEAWAGVLGDPARLHDIGALCSGCVGRGQWWRLASATVLHWNGVHLAMNMLALAGLGPAAETALGAVRFLAVYCVAGLGSMAAVMAMATWRGEPSLCVGASGAVMGVIGATAAVMLRGWLHERASVARGRGLLMAGLVAMQAVIDAMVPQMSSTAHLSGAAIGFLAALLVGDRVSGDLASRDRASGDPAAGDRLHR